MYEHFIIMNSSYALGKRIALHYVYEKGIQHTEIEDIMQLLRSACDHKQMISTHYICTDASTWESVVSYDGFFENIYIAESPEEFVYLLKKIAKLRESMSQDIFFQNADVHI